MSNVRSNVRKNNAGNVSNTKNVGSTNSVRKTSEIMLFSNPEFGEIRAIEIDGEPWFVGKLVASVLGYTDVTHAILDHVFEEDRVNSKTQGQNDPEFGQRGTWLINESGIYSLIFGSKLESAKKFKHWVTSEVLPSIRKHGAYMTDSVLEQVQNSPETIFALAETLVNERKKNEVLEKKLEETKPVLDYFNAFIKPDDLFSIRATAKELDGIKERQLINALIDKKLLYRTRDRFKILLPTSIALDKGYFAVKDKYVSNVNMMLPRTYFTTKGKEYVRRQIVNGKLLVAE